MIRINLDPEPVEYGIDQVTDESFLADVKLTISDDVHGQFTLFTLNS
jgi:hypothetical protein